MIEKALRTRLRPIVDRRRRLHLALKLSVYWLVSALIGIVLMGLYWLWGWRSPIANWALCAGAVLSTILALYRYRDMRPDYRAIARNIEWQHPELEALLLTAIEQEPEELGGQLGYLQESVVGEALRHAAEHDWLQSISKKKLALANLGWLAALSFLLVVLSQVLPSAPAFFTANGNVLTRRGYHVTVSPGDTDVESGSPVVIVARFDGRMPPEVSLLFGPSGREPQRIVLSRSLDDPVFGGIIKEVKSDLLYHVVYAGRRTRDYRISVYQYPALVRADAKIVYPAYTKLPEKVIRDTRQVTVVEGSQITLTFVLNKAVATAQLVPKEGTTLELVVGTEHPNVYEASITASQDQRYELHLADAKGLTNKVPQRFVIDVHENLPPELNPVFPNRDVVASPLEELTLQAEVSDDYGVTGCGLSYTLVGKQSEDLALSPSTASNDKQQIQHLLALEELGAQPDQLLTYYFWADDVGPDGNIRRTLSDIYFAEVRHFEEVFRESQSFQGQRGQDQRQRQSGEQQGAELARLQKQIISATWNLKQRADRSGGVADHIEDLDVVRDSQADALRQAQSALTQADEPAAIKALQEATRHMDASLEHLTEAAESVSATELMPALVAEQLAYQELLKLRDREYQVARARNVDASGSARSARSEQQLQQLELRQRENRYETERLARSQDQATQREDLQVLNRLRDLARRQNEMTDRLREAEAALRQARNEEQRQQTRRELRRLREEQLEAIRDVDELQQRMERPGNRQRMAEARDRLGQSRSRIRQSAEELEQEMVSRAITSTTRAQRQLEQMRDEFRRSTSGEFVEQMRDMRDRAQQLDQRQTEIADEIRQQVDSRQKTLTDSGQNRELADRIERQREGVQELLEQMRNVSEQAENSEPLLSRRLYDTLRTARTENVDRALEATGELLRRNWLPQAQEIERQAGEGIENLREGVEDAASSVLGDEAESLRLAREQLDELIRQVDEEVARSSEPRPRSPDPNATDGSEANQRRSVDARAGTGSRADPRGWGGNQGGQLDEVDPNGPLAGNNFRQWSDRLRDVEEILTEPDLRDGVARVRDRARSIRAEFTRHGREPQWDLVTQRISKPLTELRSRITEELARLRSDEAMVPIDRDPVPSRFAELVRRYYENLGGDG